MSWAAGGEWGWTEAWPAMGKGKGKTGGKKGKGKYQGQPEEDTWGQSSVAEHTGRIRSQCQIPHNADTDGSALVKATKMADDAFSSQRSLKRMLSTENTRLLRRPGVGLSEAAGSLQAGAATLAAVSELDLSALEQVLNKKEVKEALAMLNTTDPSVTGREAVDIASALDLLRKELSKKSELEEQAIKLTPSLPVGPTCSARIFWLCSRASKIRRGGQTKFRKPFRRTKSFTLGRPATSRKRLKLLRPLWWRRWRRRPSTAPTTRHPSSGARRRRRRRAAPRARKPPGRRSGRTGSEGDPPKPPASPRRRRDNQEDQERERGQ